MKVLTALSALLFASSALAAPGTALRRERAARLALARKTSPRTRIDETMAPSGLVPSGGNGTQKVDYSSNWAGAVLNGSGYRSVSGTIVVPTPKAPTGGSSRTTYYASAWVGIDGDSCGTAILQTGIDVAITGSSTTYSGWYEWYPDYAYDFSNFAVKAGDTVRITVQATSLRAGTAKLENLTTGKSVSHTFGTQSASLCGQNAEWIVEDFESDGGLVPFANFGKVTFTNATVGTSGGSALGVGGADIVNLKQNNRILTDCGTSGTAQVYCTYTGS